MSVFELSNKVESTEARIEQIEERIAELKEFLPYADGEARTQDKRAIAELNNELMHVISERQALWVKLKKAVKQEISELSIHIYLPLETCSLGGLRVSITKLSEGHAANNYLKHIGSVSVKDIGISFDEIDFHDEREQAIKRKLEFDEAELEAQIKAIDTAA